MHFLVLCLFVSKVHTMYSNKELEGYPAGFMSDCPGSTDEAYISKKSLKHLGISVKGPGVEFTNIRTYNYYQMKELVKNPDIDFKKKTMLFVAGYLDSSQFLFASSMGVAYRELGYNVIMLETIHFTTIEYPRAARFARPIGKHSAKMLIELTKEGLDPKKLEIVGLSLGAQTASFIGKNFQQLTGTNISRITGLDPAGPCFRNLGPDERIDKGDADFVEVIATNIDGYGMAAHVAHVTYYVNGGENQMGEVLWFVCGTLCSHLRSHSLWRSVLMNQDSFIAIQCDSVQQARYRECYDRRPMVTNLMGLKADKTKEGIFYITTTNVEPYFMGEKGLRKENDFYTSLITSLNAKKVARI